MKKLKNKVFFTIFGIFTVFTLSILLVTNIENYKKEYNSVSAKLEMNIRPRLNIKDDENMRFIDAEVYTVILNSDSTRKIFNNSFTEYNYKEINELINDILDKEEGIYINNLYSDKFAYNYSNNRITIMSLSKINIELMLSLRLSIFLFIIAELVTFFISALLSKWIIKPVIETFQKQKDFVADASHELKTPLAVIMASAEALEKDNDKKWIYNIQNESERINNLITNMLDLSKIENNTIMEEVNISKTIEKTVLTLESLMFEHNIKLDYNIEENIIFKCNNEEIKQLATILLDNAIKHSHKNSKIIVNFKNEKGTITFDVTNKGDEIPSGEEEKIFERFYRVDKSRNRNENRYGLGLAIAKSITLKHNGEISAKSKNGHTTFKVIFKKK